jgi:hypothetical protein
MERCDVFVPAALEPRRPDDYRIANDALDLFMALSRADRGALFARTSAGSLSLEASHGLDQKALDISHQEWARATEGLVAGTPSYRQRQERAFLLVPCVDGGLVVGLLYIELGVGCRRVPASHLATFAGILGRALQVRAGVVPSMAPDDGTGAPPDAERENLILLLERNEWNVARVARLLGVTRMTVYNRLRRLKVPRERVRKTQRRRAR